MRAPVCRLATALRLWTLILSGVIGFAIAYPAVQSTPGFVLHTDWHHGLLIQQQIHTESNANVELHQNRYIHHNGLQQAIEGTEENLSEKESAYRGNGFILKACHDEDHSSCRAADALHSCKKANTRNGDYYAYYTERYILYQDYRI